MIVALSGLSLLFVRRIRGLVLIVALTVVILSAMFLLITVPRIPAGGFWEDVHVGGIAHLLNPDRVSSADPEPWIVIVAACAMVNILFAVLARQMRIMLAVMGAYWLTLSIANDGLRVDPDDERWIVQDVQAVRDLLPADTTVAIDYDYSGAINFQAYGMTPFEVSIAHLPEDNGRYDAVFSSILADGPRAAGALPIQRSLRTDIAVWVYPGEVFDELDAAGELRHLPQE